MNTKSKKANISKEAEAYLRSLRKQALSFGEMIQSLRTCDELSQAELARKMGLTRANLCDIEKGRRMVSPAIAAKFAKVMGYSVHQFVSLSLEDQLKKAGLRMRVEIKAA